MSREIENQSPCKDCIVFAICNNLCYKAIVFRDTLGMKYDRYSSTIFQRGFHRFISHKVSVRKKRNESM